jgi:hypothetical protein
MRRDAMSGGKFDDVLTINHHGCLSPAGPLGLAAGETVLRFDIWVFQQDRVACIAFLPSPQGEILPDLPPPAPQEGGRWKMNPDPDDNHFGKPFQPGAALGTALLVKRVDATGLIIVEWWNTPISLVAELKSG